MKINADRLKKALTDITPDSDKPIAGFIRIEKKYDVDIIDGEKTPYKEVSVILVYSDCIKFAMDKYNQYDKFKENLYLKTVKYFVNGKTNVPVLGKLSSYFTTEKVKNEWYRVNIEDTSNRVPVSLDNPLIIKSKPLKIEEICAVIDKEILKSEIEAGE